MFVVWSPTPMLPYSEWTMSRPRCTQTQPPSVYVILCPCSSVLLYWPRPHVHCSMLLSYSPATSQLAQCMLFYVSLIYVISSLLFGAQCMGVVDEPLTLHTNPSSFSVCYSMPRILCPALLTPAQCTVFYVTVLFPRHFTTGTMYVILCTWFSVPPLQHMNRAC